MQKVFIVGGMTCAVCAARVENAVAALDGVLSARVNLVNNKLTVETTLSDDDIIVAVVKAGYSAESEQNAESFERLEDKKQRKTTIQFAISSVLLIGLMYITMFHLMWGFPLPLISHNLPLIATIEMAVTLVIMLLNRRFFIKGAKGLITGAPNMDTLVSLGSLAGFIYSTVRLIELYISPSHKILHDLYFESSAMILVLITLGKLLEGRARKRTGSAIKELMALRPKTAIIIEKDKEKIVPIKELKAGDIFVVYPGGYVPTDAVIIEGSTTLDEAAITGEGIPKDKVVGEEVYSATHNLFGFIKCRALSDGTDNTLTKIIKLVEGASATKAPIQKTADRVSGIFVPIVIAIAVITVVIWLSLGNTVGFALARGISVLVISCPCALGLATPVAIMVASGVGAKLGVLFKTAESLETLGKIKTVALDKTGTITKGTPSVTDVISQEGITEQELIKYAYMLENKSSHPLSLAVMNFAREKGMAEEYEPTDLKIIVGKGLSCTAGDGELLVGGNLSFIQEFVAPPKELVNIVEDLSNAGKTPLIFIKGNKLLGVIAVRDEIKADSISAIARLHKMGIKTVMLTGDNEITAKAFSKMCNIDSVVAGVLPDEKSQHILRQRADGMVAMVGDGINDAPALVAADVGVAIGAGTDVAIDSADVILQKSDFAALVFAIRLSKKTIKNIHENLFWAFIYNVIGIPIAAGVLIPFGITLNPMLGALFMSLSSVCVVSNALRLNLLSKKMNIKGENKMTKTIKIEGMMCPHCENHVKTALESLPQVDTAEASHKTGTAVVTLNSELSNAALKTTVEGAGYKFLEIE